MILLFGVGGCSKKNPHSYTNESFRGRTATVERRDLDLVAESIGDLQPFVQVDVKPEIVGLVKSIHVNTGQAVKKGQLLVEIDDADLLTQKASAETEIEGAKLALDKATLAAQRAKKLVEEDLISKEEADNKRIDQEIAQNNLERAQKSLQSVEAKLTKTRINAPISGSVINLPIVEGQVVIGGASASQGTLLMTLADLEEMRISTHINQVDVIRMEVGQSVEVTMDAFDDLKMTGKILSIYPVATIKNNVKGFTVDIWVNRPDPRIRPGMSANVKVPITRATSVLTVPIQAVFRENEQKIVYVKNGKNFEQRQVQVGLITLDRAEIKSGLNEGEIVSLTRPKEENERNI